MRMLNQDDESEENTESEKEALDDLAIELELADEDEPVKYKIGEALFHISLERAQALIQKDQESIEAEINGLQGKIDQCQQEMKDLKVTLYAKFGKQINLD
ncbi:unnamed protein product [Rhizoctonia solani]|uniref:Prefoldin subunit 4 n=1 Tax=Rhizoctonia solani TaxID=456999 RepID=A0A8H3HA61_9AGAM|nr:unnamed protein product [Rhizoctonia solani]